MTFSPRARRIARLTKKKPVFRPMTEDDLPVIAVAYERGAFPFDLNLSPPELREKLDQYPQRGYELHVVEDANPHFRAGRGIVALVMVKYDGWSIEPELLKFPWATRFNVVRGLVAFLLEMKRSREIGVCVIRVRDSSKKILDRITELKLLFRCGYIPNGYHDGAMWLFNVAGKKQKVG